MSSFQSGIEPGTKSCNRILQPPGGDCSNIFGTDAPAEGQQRKAVKNHLKSSIFEAETVTEQKQKPQQPQKEDAGAKKAPTSYDPITGLPKNGSGDATQPAQTAPTRNRIPPGGASSKLW